MVIVAGGMVVFLGVAGLALDSGRAFLVRSELSRAVDAGVLAGARALRSIFEQLMLDVMFEVPGRDDIKTVVLNRAVVEGQKAAILRKRKRPARNAA